LQAEASACVSGLANVQFCAWAVHYIVFLVLVFLQQNTAVVGFSSLVPNVRRYVQLAQSRGGACFCTRGAMQGYDVVLFIIALAKTVTPGGSPRREPGQAAPLTT